MLKVYDHMGALIHHIMNGVLLLAGVILQLLDLTLVAVRDLQLMVYVRRMKCTTVEKGILML
jgi:hypothetical protein